MANGRINELENIAPQVTPQGNPLSPVVPQINAPNRIEELEQAQPNQAIPTPAFNVQGGVPDLPGLPPYERGAGVPTAQDWLSSIGGPSIRVSDYPDEVAAEDAFYQWQRQQFPNQPYEPSVENLWQREQPQERSLAGQQMLEGDQAYESRYGVSPVQDMEGDPFDPGAWENYVMSAVQGATYNFGDELAGFVAGLGRGIGSLFNDQSFADAYNEGYTTERDYVRQQMDFFRQTNPSGAIASELFGAIPTSFVPGSLAFRALRPASFGGRTATGAGVGAAEGLAYGTGASEQGNVFDRLAEGSRTMIPGALGGAAGSMLTRAVQRPAVGAASFVDRNFPTSPIDPNRGLGATMPRVPTIWNRLRPGGVRPGIDDTQAVLPPGTARPNNPRLPPPPPNPLSQNTPSPPALRGQTYATLTAEGNARRQAVDIADFQIPDKDIFALHLRVQNSPNINRGINTTPTTDDFFDELEALANQYPGASFREIRDLRERVYGAIRDPNMPVVDANALNGLRMEIDEWIDDFASSNSQYRNAVDEWRAANDAFRRSHVVDDLSAINRRAQNVASGRGAPHYGNALHSELTQLTRTGAFRAYPENVQRAINDLLREPAQHITPKRWRTLLLDLSIAGAAIVTHTPAFGAAYGAYRLARNIFGNQRPGYDRYINMPSGFSNLQGYVGGVAGYMSPEQRQRLLMQLYGGGAGAGAAGGIQVQDMSPEELRELFTRLNPF